MIEAGSPGEDAADVQTLAFDLPEHVRRLDAFGGRCVMRTTGRVDVMIAAEVPAGSRIDPALEPDGDLRLHAGTPCPGPGNRHGPLDPAVFRPAPVEHRQRPWREQHVFTVGTIDLFLEEEIRRQALRLRR